VDEQETASGAAGWGWVRTAGALALGGCLTFVRDRTPDQVIEAFGMRPEAARMLTAAAAWDRFPPDGPPWIRVGESAGWTFAVEEVSLLGLATGLAARLSAGTEMAQVFWTAKPTTDLRYLADGVLVTAYEPGMEWDRAGRNPDRFLPEMRALGLRVERPVPPDRVPGEPRPPRPPARQDPLIASLDLLTAALGIRLPEEVALGPLRTVQRDTR
jgi:hypothetical protein